MQFTLSLVALLVFYARSVISTQTPYAPFEVNCPSNTNFVRPATDISPQEKQWLEGKDKVTREALIDWLSNSNLTDFNAEEFLSNDTIRIALSFSGGGFRAMLVGGGQLASLDNRTEESHGPGQLGGLLQVSTYLGGLSGGSWLVTSVLSNNFSTIPELTSGEDTWQLETLFTPKDVTSDLVKVGEWWGSIFDDLRAKKDAGFDITIIDLWGRGLSAVLYGNGDDHARGYKWSSYADEPWFKNHESPFPLFTTMNRPDGTHLTILNNTNLEINPFEIGSFDPSLYSFANLKYYGSDLSANPPKCYNGFDAMCFAAGTSSAVLNAPLWWLLREALIQDLPAISDFLDILDDTNLDVASWSPSPFNITDYGTESTLTGERTLDLVDGYEGGENVPLQPFIQPPRHIDIVFAFDSTDDTDINWPNGSTIVNTYRRQFGSQGNGTKFPYVPGEGTFLAHNLTDRPTFFGCDRNNLSSLWDPQVPEQDRHYPPVVAYIPNTEYSYSSNQATLQLLYSNDQRDEVIQNGWNTATQGNSTDSRWRLCIACAIILREQQRRGEEPTNQCRNCLDSYCWDGSLAE